VAILPFANNTGDAKLEELRSVLTLTLIHDLTGSPNIRVLPYERLLEITQGLEANGKDLSSDEATRIVADYSKYPFVVTPTMFRVGDTFRVDAGIRDMRTGEPVAYPKYERPLSRSPEETLYGMTQELSGGIQEYFKNAVQGSRYRPRPEGSRLKTVGAAIHWDEGQRAVAHGDYARALRAFEQVIGEDADFALAYAWMGQIYGTLGFDRRALEFSEKATQKITAETPAIDTYFIEANLLERKYDYASAEKKYLDLIRMYPDEPRWHDRLAITYEKQGRLQEAIASELAALGKDSNYVTSYRHLAALYTRVSDHARSVENAQKAVELSRALNNREGEAEALSVLATAQWQAGNYSEAQARAQEALRIFESLGNESGIVRAQKSLGDIHANEGRFEEALRFYQKALSRSQQVQNNRVVAVGLMNMGSVYRLLGRYAEAADHYRRSLQAAESFRDDRRRAETLSNLGSMMIQNGPDPAQGLKYVQEALALIEKSGDKGFEAFANMLSGIYHCNAALYARGMEDLNRASDIAEAAGAKSDLISIRYNIGRCQFLHNQYEPARQSVEQALDLARSLNSGYDIPRAAFLLGRIELRLGEFGRAEKTLTEAFRDARKNDYRDLLPEAHAALGELLHEQGKRTEAERYFRLAVGSSKKETLDAPGLEARVFLGLLEGEKGNVSQALSDCQASLNRAEQAGRAALSAQARLCLARLYLRQKKYAGTLDVLGNMPSQDDASLGPELLAQSCFLQSQALSGLGRTDDAERASARARELARKLQQTIPENYRESFAARREIRALLR
jgi:tetratricopeptide (TPR) repeat protein